MTGTVWPTLPDGRWLVLRTCNADMTSRNGFVWPTEGEAVAPDWDPNPALDCGNGLHGLLWGCGDALLLSPDPDARWLCVAVDPGDVANPDAGSKVRFRAGEVLFVGARYDAVTYLVGHGAAGLPVVFGTATAGNRGTATAGDDGTATAGDDGTATAGNRGTATAGYAGTATAGYRGTATAGNGGTATAGNDGTATAGNGGTATAGYRGTATAGYRGTATAGNRGTATAGDDGTLILTWWDSDAGRRRYVTAYVGEDGIEPNTPYRLDANHTPKQVTA